MKPIRLSNTIKTTLLTLSMSGFSLSYADDTEIYGTNGASDISKYAQPNVMIILDTSGSMQGSASYSVKEAYDNDTVYSGSFSRILANPNYNNSWGYTQARFEQTESNCATELATLNSEGTVTAKFREWRSSSSTWVALTSGSQNSKYIQCSDDGWEYTLHSANYVNWFHSDDKVEQVTTRMSVVQSAIGGLVDNLKDVNVGLMRFDQGGGGGLVDVPIDKIENVRTSIKNKVNAYTSYGGTPLTEVLYEAGRYYHGKSPKYGDDASPNDSVDDSISGGKYISPITAQCQKNNIILFTDGEPSGDTDANDEVSDYITDLNPPAAEGIDTSCNDTSSDGTCLDELAYYLANKDATVSYNNDQVINTYTIGGFGLNSAVELLSKTATKGQGEFHAADTEEDLAKVLAQIFEDILATNTTFTAPAVSVNAFNASEHRDELFYALFRPADKTDWAGNLKKYKLSADGVVLDKTGSSAIAEDTGYFATTAVGFWNTTDPRVADGGIVDAGGFASSLGTTRNVLSDNGVGLLLDFDNATNAELLDMDLADANEVAQLKEWIKGRDSLDKDGDGNKTESRYSIGDPLHSEPLVATYGAKINKPEVPDSTIFFGTNQGFIHAVDAEDGTEVFSYIPKELQQIQKSYFTNALAAADRPYGMDGLITSWMKDVNRNGVIYDGNTKEPNEHLYIYAGMRRGGRNYYALDVTDRSNPELKFKIEGGKGDFTNLGQTWGRMTIAKVLFKGVSQQVAFIPGGYDTSQDTNPTRVADSMGNSIYMVNAETGLLLWSASNSNADRIIEDMTNSIPGSISAIDIDGDENIDYFFAADTGGRVFRFDVNPNYSEAKNFAEGGVIADLAENDAANNRRFYSKPSVALVKDQQNGSYLSLSIGSGHRAAPISNKAVQDRFYVIKDFNIKVRTSFNFTDVEDTSFYDAYKRDEAAASVNSGTANSQLLYNATDLITGLEPSNSMKNLMINGGGWYINLTSSGEKSFTQATTFAGVILFTTFSPSGITLGCGADTGVARLYALDQQWASPAIDLNNDGTIDEKDGSNVLTHSGIAPRPVVIYRPEGEKSICIGTECIEDTRFEEKPPSEDCEENDSCEEEVFKCENNNCYVTPVYWRQNDTY